MTQFTIKLFDILPEDDFGPQWWENFRDSEIIDRSFEGYNDALQKHGVVGFRADKKSPPWGGRYVTFVSEADYLLFVLKWS